MTEHPHGTERRYQQEWRVEKETCEDCKRAHAEYVKKQRLERLAEGRIRHGTPTGYMDGCRKECCREAHRLRRQEALGIRKGILLEREKVMAVASKRVLDDAYERMVAAGWDGR